MNLRTKLELLATGALGLGLVWGYLQWRSVEREKGAAVVEAADARAVADEKERQVQQLAREKQTNEDAVNALQAERDRLTASLAAQPAPVIRLCPSPRSSGGLSATAGTAGSAGQGTPGSGAVAGVPTGTFAGPDIGPKLLIAAEVAERLAAQDRALLQRERGLH